MSAQEKLLAIIRSGEACPADILMPLFEQLEPASAESMIGTWHGGKFDGGKEPDPIHWYGKRFVSRTHVEPMLCQKEDGTVYAWDKWGAAQLREVVFGGKVQACLIYDKLPMMDYFRKVTDNLVIGLGDIKGRPTEFFFWLEREK
ncbi:MAG: DUF4334 domain-containing protein [Desulfobacteraceae bacterium]|nr:DUF4334 domain-containing protein [Desulfobacteraceae bacterium]